MIQVITETKNEFVASLFYRMATSNPEVLKALTESIVGGLRDFPFATAISFMVLSERFRSHISRDGFENWFLSYQSFPMSDVQRVVKVFPEFWKNQLFYNF